MTFDPAETPLRECFGLMIGSVLPRPIARARTQDDRMEKAKKLDTAIRKNL